MSALAARGTVAPFRRIIVVQHGANPTTDYYLAPRLTNGPEAIFTDLGDPLGLPDAVWADALVLFCRYTSSAWLARIERVPVAGVALLLDDDMPAIMRDRSAPLRYRIALWRRSVRHWPRLSRSLGALFVSTPVLAARVAPGLARVLPPLAGIADLRPAPDRPPLRIAVHATAIHRPERLWLRPVIAALLDAVPGLSIEIVADAAERRHWAGDPRVTVLPQREWTDYRAATTAHSPGILLAPLLASRANASRAPVKRIDAGRGGAALIVSDAALYGVSSTEAALGMAMPLDRAAWVRGLTALLRDPARADRLAALNRDHLERRRADAASWLVREGERWTLPTVC